MHTVRNRQAGKQRRHGKRGKARAREKQPPFMLAETVPQPPAFPAELILPPHRGAVITAASWPTVSLPPKSATPKVRPTPQPEHEVARANAAIDPVSKPALPPEPAPVAAPIEATSGPVTPLPAARALAVRRQGFVDILAFVLRDSGRRLARWSSARRKTQDLKDKLAHAEARMRAMEAQMAALQALQERVRQST